MFISSLTDRGATPALVGTAVFNQHRLAVIAENVANFGTPGYRAKHLDMDGFQRALGRALEDRRGDPSKPFVIEHGREARTRADGSLEVQPTTTPVDNILFHDGTNMSIEREMSELAKTGALQESVVALLRGRMDGLRKAIRGHI